MGFNKHEILAEQMQKLITDLDCFTEKVRDVLTRVQLQPSFLIFCFGYLENSVLNRILKVHYFSLKIINPRLLTKILGLKNFQILEGLDRSHEEAFLFCPSGEDSLERLDRVEGEDYDLCLTSQFVAMQGEYIEQDVLTVNLGQKAEELFKKIAEDWGRQWRRGGDFPHDFRDVLRLDFAPKSGASMGHAYESVLRSIRSRKLKKEDFVELRKYWKESLEGVIFQKLPWNGSRQQSYLLELKSRVFHKPSARSRKNRGTQGRAISKGLAANLIMYFVKRFIEKPVLKHYGEIACILWTLVWLSQEIKEDRITISTVVSLTSKQVLLKENCLLINGEKIKISKGLTSLYEILVGEGEAKRGMLLFSNVRIKNDLKNTLGELNRALKVACSFLIPKEPIVLPQSFLTFPHPFGRGDRISKYQRKNWFSKKYNPNASILRNELMKIFTPN